MIYGYLRVSSDVQDINSQKQGVVKFANDHGWKIEKYITDEGVSGGKDPDKRKLGPLLSKVTKGDVIICSEISRLGRDLYMVMDILHYCMKVGAIIYTVKDRFVLGDDIQSKVLAFAFGLSAEIERQMIRQRTREGLRLRMKMGVLMGRTPEARTRPEKRLLARKDRLIRELLVNGTSLREIGKITKHDRSSVARYAAEFCRDEIDERVRRGYPGINVDWKSDFVKNRERSLKIRKPYYKDTPYEIVDIDRDKAKRLIEEDKTLPEMSKFFPELTYEQLYDTVLCDAELNRLYRQHAQLKLVKHKSKSK